MRSHFSRFLISWYVGVLFASFGVRYYGISGLVERRILVLARTILIFRSLKLEGLTDGDDALETDADFLAVIDHRLAPAKARSEGKRLWRFGLVSVWAPASQFRTCWCRP